MGGPARRELALFSREGFASAAELSEAEAAGRIGDAFADANADPAWLAAVDGTGDDADDTTAPDRLPWAKYGRGVQQLNPSITEEGWQMMDSNLQTDFANASKHLRHKLRNEDNNARRRAKRQGTEYAEGFKVAGANEGWFDGAISALWRTRTGARKLAQSARKLLAWAMTSARTVHMASLNFAGGETEKDDVHTTCLTIQLTTAPTWMWRRRSGPNPTYLSLSDEERRPWTEVVVSCSEGEARVHHIIKKVFAKTHPQSKYKDNTKDIDKVHFFYDTQSVEQHFAEGTVMGNKRMKMESLRDVTNNQSMPNVTFNRR